MANVNVKFNNKDYLLSCDDGQEESLKKLIEKQNQELMREHKYLKEKIKKLQLEVNKRAELESRFNQDIEELSQETESLVNEIDKWQM